jgi:hypothetical protein
MEVGVDRAMHNWADQRDILQQRGRIIIYGSEVRGDGYDPQYLCGYINIPGYPEQDFRTQRSRNGCWDKLDNQVDSDPEETPAPRLDEKDRTLLRDDHLIQIAAQYGYQIEVSRS